MSKLERLRPMEFAKAPPEGRETVVRIEYSGAGRGLGFLELVKVNGGPGGKPDYFLQTERTRLFAKLSVGGAEQLEQDLGSVVR